MNLKKLLLLPAILMAMYSCDDSTTIGSSLLEDQVEIIVDSAFTVTGRSVAVQSIRPRSVEQLIGAIEIGGYGRLESGAVAQLLPTVSMDTARFTAENIDSLFLNLRYVKGGFIGDSIVPMAVTVYPLTRQLPADIASDFNPEGYFSPSDILGTKTYNTAHLDNPNPVSSADVLNTIAVKLPLDFGRYLFDSFVANPSNFANGQVFTQNVFAGMYIKSTYGSGRLMDISRTTITMNMRKISYNEEKEDNDTISDEQEYMFVSPEVINNNILHVELDPQLVQRANDGEALMVAPGCYETSLRLPVPEIISSYRSGSTQLTVLNSVSVSIPVDSIETAEPVSIPPYALLVLESKRDEFFANNSLPDDKTSFYAEYDAVNGCYLFATLGNYLKEMIEKENLEESDYTFRLIPVQISFELDSSSYYYQNYIVSDVVPYFIAPAAAVLRLGDAKVKLTYSRQTSLR